MYLDMYTHATGKKKKHNSLNDTNEFLFHSSSIFIIVLNQDIKVDS